MLVKLFSPHNKRVFHSNDYYYLNDGTFPSNASYSVESNLSQQTFR